MHIERVEWVTSGCWVLHYSCEVLFYESSILARKFHYVANGIVQKFTKKFQEYKIQFAQSAKLVRFKILIVICSFCRHCFTNLEQTLQR